jgi:hypothetical protein
MCQTGFTCAAGTPRTCTACGSAIGQPCCGGGAGSVRTCDATLGLSCVNYQGTFVCDTTP